jgi:hypothetical protein
MGLGTTAGNAAAGNDSRITGALQASALVSTLAAQSIAVRNALSLGTAATQNIGTTTGTVADGSVDPIARSAAAAAAAAQVTANGAVPTFGGPVDNTVLFGRKLMDRAKDTINVLDVQAAAGLSDDAAIRSALSMAALRPNGARVYLPPKQNGACYSISASLQPAALGTSYYPVAIEGDGAGSCVQPTMAMTSMLVLPGRFAKVQGINFSNANGYATNAVELSCAIAATNPNNFVSIDGNFFYSFVNGVKNDNCDGWRVKGNWFQNQTGWDVWSADNGTASQISRNYSVGSAGNVLYQRINYAAEGYYIDHNLFLPTGGKGIVIQAGLSFFIESNQIDQTNDTPITLDGTGAYPIADVGISDNWTGFKSGATASSYNLQILGNVVEARLDTNTFNGASKCGVLIKSGGPNNTNTVQNVRGSGNRFVFGTGSAAGTGDVCYDTSIASAGPIVWDGNWFLSGGTKPSVYEPSTNPPLAIYKNNRMSVPPVKGGVSLWRDNYGDDMNIVTGKYAAWGAYTPTLSCGSGTLGGTAVATGKFDRNRNTVSVTIQVRIPDSTAAGTCTGNLFVGLPAQSAATAPAVMILNGFDAGHNAGLIGVSTGSFSNFPVYLINGGLATYSGANLLLNGTYEAVP